MKPSEVRARILSDHVEILGRLETMVSVAAVLDDSDDLGAGELRRSFMSLFGVLIEHMALEDAVLAPALREADAWGDVRIAQLEEHHRAQRRELLETLERLHDLRTTPTQAAQLVCVVAANLRDDIALEDRALLSADVLRDDIISIDANSG